MRILIVGGGFSGLTLAALLRQTGQEAMLIEREEAYAPVGYVIGLWPLGSRILHGLGLYDQYLEVSVEGRVYQVCDRHGKVLHKYDIGPFFERYGSFRCVTRAALLNILVEYLGNDSIRMGTSIESLEQVGEEVQVTLSDGREETFDLVVGCDGIHSKTRELLFGIADVADTGWAGWAWWVDPSVVPQDSISEFWSDSHFFGLYPAKGKLCCFSGVPYATGIFDDPKTRAKRIQDAFQDFGGPVPTILNDLDSDRDISFVRFADVKLEQWHKGRVLLVGDSGQGILPTAGIGATVAMESAAVLADELRRTDARTIPLAIEYFEKRRRDRVDSIQAESRKLAKMMFTESAAMSWAINHMMKFYSEKQLFKGFSKTLEQTA